MNPEQPLARRRFIQSSATVALVAAPLAARAKPANEAKNKPIKKAVKIGMVRVKGSLTEKMKALRELGFDGVELNSPNNRKLSDVLRARDDSGLPIHGVVDSVHWRDTLSHADPKVRARGVTALKRAVRDAKAYGATSALLVPAVVSKTVSYDQAYRRSQAEIKKVLPLAEDLGIRIGLENVWNNFLLSPMETARYVDELESKAVGVYFDVGNIVRYGWPEHWIRVLGKRIIKLDIKEYSRKKQFGEGTGKGFGVKLLEGDCDWPAVMKALREIGYKGWGTAEIPGGGRERLADIARRMDRIFAS